MSGSPSSFVAPTPNSSGSGPPVSSSPTIETPSTNKVINGYQWAEIVGRGTWGKVRRVIHLASGREAAVKIIYRIRISRKIRGGLELLYKEYELVRSLEHPNIIKYYELDDHSKPEKLYLFMELATGTIAALLPEQGRLFFIRDKFRQLLAGLAYLHSQRVAHHDIKPDNVLIVVPSGQVKISDFGVAERYDPEKGCRIFYGTPAYQGPEIAGNTSGVAYDGAKADVWSAGVLLYQLLLDKLPYTGDTIYLLLKAIESDPVPLARARSEGIPETIVDLLAHLLEKDPVKRYSALEALHHPWLIDAEDPPAQSAFPVGSCCRVL